MPDTLTGRTIAVTGAAGFIGGRLVDRLAGEAGTVVRVARSPLPPIAPRGARIVDIVADLSAREAWEAVVDADVIFHLAAQTSAAAAAADPDADFRANVLPIRHLLAGCRDRRHSPIVLFAGTVTEAGIPARLPVNEDAADEPITVYDRHKLLAESDLKQAAADGVIIGATLRLANVYGPGSHRRRADRDVLNRMIERALHGEPLAVHGSGGYVRDYVFIDDVVEALVMAAGESDRVNARHFVIGSGSGVTIRQAFELIAARVEQRRGRRVAVTTDEHAPAPSPIERRSFIADHSRFTAATGWRPQCSLSDGIDRTIEALTCA